MDEVITARSTTSCLFCSTQAPPPPLLSRENKVLPLAQEEAATRGERAGCSPEGPSHHLPHKVGQASCVGKDDQSRRDFTIISKQTALLLAVPAGRVVFQVDALVPDSLTLSHRNLCR